MGRDLLFLMVGCWFFEARLMRYFAALRVVKEVGEDNFQASDTSVALTSEGHKADITYL